MSFAFILKGEIRQYQINEPGGVQNTSKYNINAHQMIHKPTMPKRKDLIFDGGNCFTFEDEVFCVSICHVSLKVERRTAQPFALTIAVADHRLCLKAAAQPFVLTAAVADRRLCLKATVQPLALTASIADRSLCLKAQPFLLQIRH